MKNAAGSSKRHSKFGVSLWAKVEPIEIPFSKLLEPKGSASQMDANPLKTNRKHPYSKVRLDALIKDCIEVKKLSFTDTVIALAVSPTTVRRVCRTLKLGRYRDEVPSELRSNSSQTPYGWKVHLGLLEKDPAEWRNVEFMFRVRNLGFSLHEIAAELTKRNIPTKNGGKWFAKSVSQILKRNAKHLTTRTQEDQSL